MSARKHFNPPAVLPSRFRVPITRADAEDAVCGSVTDCTIARAIEHQLRRTKVIGPKDKKPGDFFIKVKPNRVMVRVRGVYHQLNLPDKAINIIRQTDSGGFELIRETSLVLLVVHTARQNPTWQDPARKAQINAARMRRKAEGRPDKVYPNERVEAAIRNGVRGKKLGSVRHAA
jgi:hypothetical protein